MIKKLLLPLVAFAFIIQSCSTAPEIQTRHKFVNSKKSVPTKAASDTHKKLPTYPAPDFTSGLQNTVSATTVVSSASTVTTLPPLAPSTGLATDFKLAPDKTDKPHSTATFSLNSKKIGVILPMTGKNAGLGQQALAAIRLGLGLEEKDPSFSIVVFDTKSNPDLAGDGVEKLLRDEGVVAILGGLSSKEAQNISTKAEFFQVPFFAFSQKSGLTDATEYTFRNAVTPEMQVERLVQYAAQTLGAKKFAILYPNDAYGVEFSNKYWNLVLAAGGAVTAAQAYDPKDTDLNIYVQKLVGTYYSDARLDEYRQRRQEINIKNKKKIEAGFKKKLREHDAGENVLNAVLDFDVLFVPDTSKALGQVIAFMKNNDVGQMTYLGTNLWNTSELGRRAGPNTPNIFFVDSQFSQEELQKSDFHAKYTALYHEVPTIVEAQVFEAAKVLRDIIGSSSVSRNSLAYQLNVLGRKDGAYTKIKMNSNHEVERPLNIFGLSEGQIQRVE